MSVRVCMYTVIVHNVTMLPGLFQWRSAQGVHLRRLFSPEYNLSRHLVTSENSHQPMQTVIVGVYVIVRARIRSPREYAECSSGFPNKPDSIRDLTILYHHVRVQFAMYVRIIYTSRALT